MARKLAIGSARQGKCHQKKSKGERELFESENLLCGGGTNRLFG
jgi:hypothetical protein